MTSSSTLDLAPLFQAVEQALSQNRAALNLADVDNGNHGDHMVEVFQVAAGAAREQPSAELGRAMIFAAERLDALPENGSARLYAQGLRQIGEQFAKYAITLDDLVSYSRKVLGEANEVAGQAHPDTFREGDVLKALVAGITAWGQVVNDQPVTVLNMGALFEFGMAYLQARERGGSRIEVISDAAASVSPLSKTPYRYQSCKVAIQAFLQTLQEYIHP